MSRRTRTRNTFRPEFEKLEDRWTPSCTILQDGGDLFITGDGLANRIEIVDQDRAVLINCDGEEREFTDVAQIFIDTGAGNDRVMISIPEPAAPAIDFYADLGTGDDSFDFVMGAPGPHDGTPLEPRGPVSVDVRAGAGNDQVNVTFFDIFFTETNIQADLGTGNDAFQTNFDIADLGRVATRQLDPGNFVALVVNGQNGNDTFGLQVGTEVAGAPQDFLNSSVAASFDGGAGSDSAVIGIFNVAVNGPLTTALNMGNGNDRVAAETTGVDLNGALTTNIVLGNGSDVMAWNNHDVAVNGTFELNVQGGAGNDVIIGDFQPCIRPEGQYRINFAGDAGNDVILAVIELDEDSLGPLNVNIQGGAGNDRLGLQVGRIGDPGIFQLHVDGGDGFDIAWVSRGIDVHNCEVIVII